MFNRPYHSSGGFSPASNRGGTGSNAGQAMWDLWWTKFSPSASVSPANSHSTDCYTSSSIIRGWYSRPFFFNLCGGTLGTAATTGLLYQPRIIGGGDCGEIGGIKIGRGNRSTRRKPAPLALCPPQISHD
jgi:hypothetical protein